MTAYYNENDPHAAAWLRNLINGGHIAPGDVDERDIRDVRPLDLLGYTQCHFFAGVGVWSYALRLAGWADTRRVWTGSCPCQPFSGAGRGDGFDDERHLWPAWQHLIEECRPAICFGEQVADKRAEPWIDLVQDDMEGMDYAFGTIPFPAAGVGAPNRRDRLYWVADAQDHGRQGWFARQGAAYRSVPSLRQGAAGVLAHTGRGGLHQQCREPREQGGAGQRRDQSGDGYAACGVGDAGSAGLEGCHDRAVGRELAPVERDGPAGGLDHAFGDGRGAGWLHHPGHAGNLADAAGAVPFAEPAAGPVNGMWRDADWLFCTDGKWRPVEPGTFPLVHGAAGRVGRLRAYGNAINAQAAAVFIRTYRQARGEAAGGDAEMTLEDMLQ